MDIDGIMKMISFKDTGYAHNPAEMKLAIEQYAKAERESMRQACIKACEGGTHARRQLPNARACIQRRNR